MARLHLVGFPFSQTTRDVTVCAFTAKLVKFAEMMAAVGQEVVVYSGEHNDAPCVEHVMCFTDAQQLSWYGEVEPNRLPTAARWEPHDPSWLAMNVRAAAEIRERAEPHDLVLLSGGESQKMIADALPDLMSVEWGVGYEGIFSAYCCFESYAWMHYLYGRWGIRDTRHFDSVIPNFFRADDFAISEHRSECLLYVGRMTERKGIREAVAIAEACGRRLLMAGPGVERYEPNGPIVCEDGTVLNSLNVEYVGVLDAAERAAHMADALALLAPTTYIEPFGGVAVEAMLCGVPVIATDIGAFTETVAHRLTGFRFRSLAGAVEGVELADSLDPQQIREHALRQFSIEAVGPRYLGWFDRLGTLWREGWYEMDTEHA